MDRPQSLSPISTFHPAPLGRAAPRPSAAPAAVLRATAAIALALGAIVLSTGCTASSSGQARSSTATPAASASTTRPALTDAQRQQNIASFDKVWTLIRDRHFDPKLNGADWDGARAELRPKVEAAASKAEARAVMLDLISRLKQTHFSIIDSDAYDEGDNKADSKSEATAAKSASGSDAAPTEAARATAQAADKDASTTGENRRPATRSTRPDGYLGLTLRGIADGPAGTRAIITRVAPGSPADKAGIKTGWEVVSVGKRQLRPAFARSAERAASAGVSTTLMQALIASRALSAEQGKTLHLGLLDENDKARVVSVTAAPPAGKPAAFGHLPPTHLELDRRLLPGNIGYMSISIWLDPTRTVKFMEETVSEFHNAQGLIIDLRGNPGGLGVIAPAIAGYLISGDSVTMGTLATREFKQRFLVYPRPKAFTGPVAVLVDELSMSTSEIFAGGLKDIGRARIFGTPTPGAALPSLIEVLPNGDRFQYAYANYLSASGTQLEGKGVTPDETVPLSRPPFLAGQDPVIEAASTWIRQQPPKSPNTVSTTHP